LSFDLSQLDVFYGELTVNRALVYARLPRPTDDAFLTLSGQVRGPRCLHAETLPLAAPLVDLGRGPTLLARALVPEPCFWSPDLPAIYDVTVHLQRGDETIATTRRELGLRSLGVRGRHFVLEAKHWVLRGVFAQSTGATLPRSWHEAAAVYVTEEADDERLAEASQWGALAIIHVDGNPDEIAVRLRQLAMHPAVAVAVIRGDVPPEFKPAVTAPNRLLAQPVATASEFAVRPWANLLWADATEHVELAKLRSISDLPIVAVRRLTSALALDEARTACDRLQRDLAPVGQFAGYVV
jgi:hypothetical protein